MGRITLYAFLFAILFSSVAFGQVEPYVGGQYMRSGSACQGFKDGVAPLGLTATCPSTSDNGFRFFGGANFGKIFGAEAGYQDGGDGHADAFNGSTPVLSLTAPFKAWDFLGTARHQLNRNVSIQGHAGVAAWNYEVKASATNFGAKNDKATFTYGAGVEYGWLIAGYDAVLKVGQPNLLVPTQDIKQTIHSLRVGLKYTFKEH